MSYTAEQLRAKARNLRELGRQLAADDCEAHADALEENARLRANRDFWHEACEQAQQHRDSANEQLAIADAEIAKLKDEQARAAKIVEGVEGSVGSGAAAMTYTAWDYRKLAEYHEQLAAERERADRLMRLAYLAGWNASGEGYNAEYPFGDSDMDPEADAKWIAVRDTALDAARRK